ncbi:acylglycerol kinase family protein [Qipengyuania sp. 1NDH17]|uniref:Acylglycerol kinase family protein n=1 Tax=Qipengyuania polymorpha TaxID=2867234 RepID=A0ABS7J2C3_9SPHN|nr:acylglycerol kinase family protein [Qipengyuania polymorpha]MBX7458715.1 acylglycerol kinase family protein [Qipengyuania polymorpha]
MADDNPIWLLTNSRSGSNSERAIAALETHCRDRGFSIARKIGFPDDDLPTAEELDAAGIGRLAIFTGDGTLNAAITQLRGWGGQIAVLPGGTMNLLSKRLHGPDAALETIIERIASGATRAVRPLMARCEKGDALAGLLAGPGTSWASVREAMRDFDIPAMAEGTSDALAETTGGSMVRVCGPRLGKDEGYPLIEFTPSHRGMQLDAFHAEGAGELLQQSWALLRRNFREGPHTRLGLVDEVTLETCDGAPLEVLIDGEPATLPPKATFTVAPCEVDLLATHHGF